ncbi:MAG: hypothetical protein O7H39_00040 [Gammaproteobacteria bacterium]|nr:hypothetical protein [Gammaproteobacteria bacterium]
MRTRWAGIASISLITAISVMSAATYSLADPHLEAPVEVKIERLLDAAIVTAALHPSIGQNIQGPSLIRVPDWVVSPLGRYYLYFADHKGTYIRLAYADQLVGPWTIHPPGSLQLADSHFPTERLEAPPELVERVRNRLQNTNSKLPHDIVFEMTTAHIASPDVHVRHDDKRIVMYFHGLQAAGSQASRVATSTDGINFVAQPQIIGRTYMRAFAHDGSTYAMAMPGQFYRSRDGFTDFETGPLLFNPDMRHAALLNRGDTLYVFWTQVGQTPERILLSTIDISGDWMQWKDSAPIDVLRPERDWEGADAPLEPSVRSVAYGHVNQLRDPAIYVEGDRTFLLYAVAGESGIALAEIALP